MVSNLRNLVRRRDLVLALVRGDLEARTAGRRIGWLWWLLDPLLMMAIYWALVAGVLGRGREAGVPYPLFILGTLVAWKHFAGSASAAASALRAKEGLIRSVAFPTMVLPIASVLSRFVLFLFGFAVFAGASLVWPAANARSALALVQLAPLLALQLLLVLGISLFLCCAGALFRDLPELLAHALRALYYASPGLYGVEMVRERLDAALAPALARPLFELYMLNPFAVLFTGYRDAVLYGTWLEPRRWLALVVVALVTLALGYRFYQRFDRRVIKRLG